MSRVSPVTITLVVVSSVVLVVAITCGGLLIATRFWVARSTTPLKIDLPTAGELPKRTWKEPEVKELLMGTDEVRFGDFVVSLTDAQQADAVATTVDDTTSFGWYNKEPHLVLFVRVKNTHETLKRTFRGWGRKEDPESVVDQFGNKYNRVGVGLNLGQRILGSQGTVDLHPGKTETDLLVFDWLTDKASWVTIDLPAGNVGGTGFMRWKIDRKLIKKG